MNSALYIHIDVGIKESRTLQMNLSQTLQYISILMYVWKSHELYIWTCHHPCTIHLRWYMYERVTNFTCELVTKFALCIRINICMKESRTLHMNLSRTLHYTSILMYVWKSHELWIRTCHELCTVRPYWCMYERVTNST